MVTFAIRFAIFFAVSLMPVPGLADVYTTAFAHATNGALALVDGPSRVAVRVEAPARIEAHGSWKANMLLADRETGRTLRTRFDTRSFSFRPIATFIALAAASHRRGRRRNAIVWGGGLALMAVLTTALSALPLLSRFGAAGALGTVPGLVVQTMYQALATPVMICAIAVIAWGLVSLVAARDRDYPATGMRGSDSIARRCQRASFSK